MPLLILTIIVLVVESCYLIAHGPKDSEPKLETIYIFRSALLLLFSMALVKMMSQRKRMDKYEFQDFNNKEKTICWDFKERMTILFLLVLNAFFISLLFISPSLFTSLAIEDGLVEYSTALLFLISSGLMVSQIKNLKKKKYAHKKWMAFSFLFLSLMFFLIGMEEISWFQRIVGFSTPDSWMEINRQDEFNFHNIHSGAFEYAFYTGSFLFLIFLPFLKSLAINIPFSFVRELIGSESLFWMSSFFVAYNFDMWNQFPTQITFFLTIFILIDSLTNSQSTNNVKIIQIVTLICLTVTQMILIVWGDNSLRSWDATEYKEFYISVGFLLYSLGVRKSLRRLN